MPELITTLGPKSSSELGMILPHEHVFVDLRTWDKPGYAQAEVSDVISLMVPELEKARAAGVTAIVEVSPVGVGRRVDILRAVSRAANFPLVAPTGIYREPWIPPWAHEATESLLSDWMRHELNEQIEDTGVKAGMVKLSAGDDGMTPTEEKVLRAAVRAADSCNAAIASHTIHTAVVRQQLKVVEELGYDPARFVWIHASAEPDVQDNIEIARRGPWIEYDFIGGDFQTDEYLVERVQRMLDAGLGGRLLLSHDRGWYDPAQPGGGTPRSFAYISEEFLPKLRRAGVDDATIRLLTCANPFAAFAR